MVILAMRRLSLLQVGWVRRQRVKVDIFLAHNINYTKSRLPPGWSHAHN